MCPKRVYTDGVRCAVWRAGRGGILDIGPIKSDTAHAFRAKLQAPPRDAENSIPYTVVVSSEMRDQRTQTTARPVPRDAMAIRTTWH